MDKNFTPLDVGSVEKKQAEKKADLQSFDINTVFLALIVVTLLILAVLLFILIQKKMQELAIFGVFA